VHRPERVDGVSVERGSGEPRAGRRPGTEPHGSGEGDVLRFPRPRGRAGGRRAGPRGVRREGGARAGADARPRPFRAVGRRHRETRADGDLFGRRRGRRDARGERVHFPPRGVPDGRAEQQRRVGAGGPRQSSRGDGRRGQLTRPAARRSPSTPSATASSSSKTKRSPRCASATTASGRLRARRASTQRDEPLRRRRRRRRRR